MRHSSFQKFSPESTLDTINVPPHRGAKGHQPSEVLPTQGGGKGQGEEGEGEGKKLPTRGLPHTAPELDALCLWQANEPEDSLITFSNSRPSVMWWCELVFAGKVRCPYHEHLGTHNAQHQAP